jgi:alpha-N-arabinofuranosidase
MNKWTGVAFSLLLVTALGAKEVHVSTGGHDTNGGSASNPFSTISAAALVAQPGDTIIVHQGIYRERIDPPRGGTSDSRRIVYQAAPGEEVAIKGSEIMTGWQPVQNDTWKVTIPNAFFGSFNPYQDAIHGDWFKPMGREHHTGAVYLKGHWLTEASQLEHVLAPVEQAGSLYWYAEVDATNTAIWAQFKDVNPNEAKVEINARQAVFYPSKPGINCTTTAPAKTCLWRSTMGPSWWTTTSSSRTTVCWSTPRAEPMPTT